VILPFKQRCKLCRYASTFTKSICHIDDCTFCKKIYAIIKSLTPDEKRIVSLPYIGAKKVRQSQYVPETSDFKNYLSLPCLQAGLING